MTVAQLLQRLSDSSVRLYLEDDTLRFRAPKGALTKELRQEIAGLKNEIIEALKCGAHPSFPRHPAQRFEPFPLTDLQQAYFIGEADFYDFRTVSHLYQCYRIDDLDFDRLKLAVAKVMEAHDVLRIVVRSAEEQCVLPVLPYEPEYEDLRGLPIEVCEARASELGDGAGTRLAPLDQGPTWWVRAQELDSGWFLHVAVRLVAFDAVTLHSIYRDLAGYYDSDDYVAPVGGLSYRDYVLGIDAHRRSLAAERARGYWMKRLHELPDAPQMPRRSGGRSGQVPLKRLTGTLGPQQWSRFQETAKSLGCTVNAALCQVYADTLRRWSGGRDFAINLLSANRPPVEPEVARVVGNCSTTTLIAVPNEGTTFQERALGLQRQIYADLANNGLSGVGVIRELERIKPRHGEPPMPVVFSSGVGLLGTSERFELTYPRDTWRLKEGRLSTAQVWLDHQVMEDGAELLYNWDFVPKHFPAGVIETAYEHYVGHLGRLADDPAAWRRPVHALAAGHLEARRRSNNTFTTLAGGTLYGLFEETAHRLPREVALCFSGGTATYRDLLVLASAQRRRLEAAGIQRGDLVGVYVRKGLEQIVAVLGVLQLGASYLPLDSKTPSARVRTIIEHSDAQAIVVDDVTASRFAESEPTKTLPVIDRSQIVGEEILGAVSVDPSSVAYVIYTSGSTGTPKGVVIDHAAAVNTIRDVNARFGVTASDRILGLSSLAFDLSVYDIFGAFEVGAALVLPDEEASPNPALWLAAAEAHGATVWNSVPALLEMAVEYCGAELTTGALMGLRLAMLSGDWLPLPLVGRLLRDCPSLRLVSLGGATEAAIWSCYYEIGHLDSEWNSVPYGRPLANQTLHVLDAEGRECPNWVWGDLFIGGAGLMKGYLNDAEKSRQALVTKAETSGVLYRTGDRARWLPDGTVEFGGRQDNQVKLRGYRIELGEIENVLTSHPHVESAVVLLTGDRDAEKRLVGYLTPELQEDVRTEIERYLRNRLPTYMVPSVLLGIPNIPLTANGKVDRNKLAEDAALGSTQAPARRSFATDTERRLGALWMQILDAETLAAKDDFFAVGGNSLLAVRLFNGIEQEFGRRLRLSTLFEARTVAAQAKLLDERQAEAGPRVDGAMLLRNSDTPADVVAVLLHPVGGDVLCYDALVGRLSASCEVYGIRSPAIDGDRKTSETISGMVREYCDWIVPIVGKKRLVLIGWSMGGMLAMECARELDNRGVEAKQVYMIDSWVGSRTRRPLSRDTRLAAFLTDLNGGTTIELGSSEGDGDRVARAVKSLKAHSRFEGIGEEQLQTLFEVYERHIVALEQHELAPFDGGVTLFSATHAVSSDFNNLEPFSRYADALLSSYRSIDLSCDHYGVVAGTALAEVCRTINADIDGLATIPA